MRARGHGCSTCLMERLPFFHSLNLFPFAPAPTFPPPSLRPLLALLHWVWFSLGWYGIYNPPSLFPTPQPLPPTQVKASLIVVYTHTSRVASLVAKYRPPMPILTLVVPRLTSDGLHWKLQGKGHARQCLLVRGGGGGGRWGGVVGGGGGGGGGGGEGGEGRGWGRVEGGWREEGRKGGERATGILGLLTRRRTPAQLAYRSPAGCVGAWVCGCAMGLWPWPGRK